MGHDPARCARGAHSDCPGGAGARRARCLPPRQRFSGSRAPIGHAAMPERAWWIAGVCGQAPRLSHVLGDGPLTESPLQRVEHQWIDRCEQRLQLRLVRAILEHGIQRVCHIRTEWHGERRISVPHRVRAR